MKVTICGGNSYMRATIVDKLKPHYYSPTYSYMLGLQGNWIASDYYSRSRTVYPWILEEKRRERR